MEQDNSKVAWGKALKPIFALLLVIVLWQVLVLEMLKNGIISTLIAVVLVSAVSVVIFGIVFWVVKSLLNQFLTIAQGKTEDEQEQTKIGEKAKKLMEREDDIGLMMRSVHEENAEEERKVQIVKSAISTLSFSELEAITHIFDELDGSEGILVASRIADRVGITRSVIVNALRKFESAGVIESRSSGMKGTYIKVINDVVFDELDKLKKQREKA